MKKEYLTLATSIKLDSLGLSKEDNDGAVFTYKDVSKPVDIYTRCPAIDIVQAEEIIIKLLKELGKQ